MKMDDFKQECIVSAKPTVYSTVPPTPPPPGPPPHTHTLSTKVVFASKSLWCGDKEEVEE